MDRTEHGCRICGRETAPDECYCQVMCALIERRGFGPETVCPKCGSTFRTRLWDMDPLVCSSQCVQDTTSIPHGLPPETLDNPRVVRTVSKTNPTEDSVSKINRPEEKVSNRNRPGRVDKPNRTLERVSNTNPCRYCGSLCKPNRKHCDMTCYNMARYRDRVVQERYLTDRGVIFHVPCARCGEPILIRENVFVRKAYPNRAWYCSQSCYRERASDKKLIKETKRTVEVCPTCGRPFIRYKSKPQTYCSRACTPTPVPNR